MARKARVTSDSLIYHTIVRGNNAEHIFQTMQDKERIVDILYQKAENDNYEVLAYCILNDHAHFLLQEGALPVAEIMKRLTVSYAAYYNRKRERYGHVFYGRYLSESVEDHAHLLEIIKYLLKHPAKITKDARASALHICPSEVYKEYCDTAGVGVAGKEMTYERFLQEVHQQAQAMVLDLNRSEQEMQYAQYLMQKYLYAKGIECEDLKDRNYCEIRNKMVLKLKENTNLSIRKIAEVLELNRGIVYRIICDTYEE